MKRFTCIMAFFAAGLFLLASHASGTTVYTVRPPSNLSREPVFRIETGTHSALARRVAVDAGNRYVITGSDDKTVRVWDLATGNPVKILRPPVGSFYEGSIYSVALSPDGATIACGGWSMGGEIAHNIYLFDRESGRIKGRIPDVQNVIRHLKFSRDGQYLAAMLGGENGHRVYHIPSNRLVAAGNDYGDDSFWGDFDGQNRLITSSYDGFIRLYDRSFGLLAKVKTEAGRKPVAVTFSPDGSKVAVGFNDCPKVEVRSGTNLSFLYSPDTSFADNGNIEIVTWSDDGAYLYGGGRFQADGVFPILKWSREGKGGVRQLGGILHSILDMTPLTGGGLVYVSAGPTFGTFTTHGDRALRKDPAIADFRDREAFFSSADTFTIRFEYDVLDRTTGDFSVQERMLKVLPPAGSRVPPPNCRPTMKSADSPSLTNWEDSYEPRLKGVPLRLERYEMSRSAAISSNGTRILLGTSWNLRLFDISGTEIWRVTAPATPWAMNISGNGRVAVVAFGDGVIRWYRMTDGANILNFFPHRDMKRWILWTPSGYYQASAGAEELIGWHMNNSADMESDFFPVSRFRNTYYRPDVIDKLMETLDEHEAVVLANRESGRREQREQPSVQKILPPVVAILSPADNTMVAQTNVAVRFSVRSPSGEAVTDIKALVNGRPVTVTKRDLFYEETGSTTAGFAGTQPPQAPPAAAGAAAPLRLGSLDAAKGDGSGIRQVTVTVPPEDARISIIASNRFAASEPATVRIRWQGQPRKEEFIVMPKLYILAIGVGRYPNFPVENQLKFASKDAKDFVTTMAAQKGALYRDVEVRLLMDETATRDSVLDGLEWIQRSTTSKDVAMIFLSGHGINDSTGVYYFIPSNFDKTAIKRTGVPYGDIKNTIANLAGKTLVFVDTCHSGNIMGSRKALGDMTNIANELASAENGAVVFASSTGRQYSLERPDWNNGAFTKALVEGLNGRADYTRKGRISINMLDLYLSERVKELTEGQQTPTTTKPQTIQDFPIAVVRR